MDPVSQGVFGGLWAQSASRGKGLRASVLSGWLAGMAPDLDVLIRSSNDELLALDYHRHFTHAIPFAPVGGLIVALALFPFLKRQLRFGQLYLFCFLGYLSHGLLDAFTSYGTHLAWPFSDYRSAWNWISVIDPLFTLPLLLLLGLGLWRRRQTFCWIAIAWATLYLGLGGWQQQRAEQAVQAWASTQNLDAQRLVAKPSFANLLLWRGLVDDGQQFHSVAIRLKPGKEPVFYPGESVTSFNPAAFKGDGQLKRDLQRFEHFSAGWLFRYPPEENGSTWFIGDFRYAIDPASERPLWGIRFDPGAADQGVRFERLRELDVGERNRYWSRLWGDSLGSDNLGSDSLGTVQNR